MRAEPYLRRLSERRNSDRSCQGCRRNLKKVALCHADDGRCPREGESIEKLKRTPGLAFRKLARDKRVGAYTARLIYLAMLAGLIDYVEKDDSDDTGMVKFVSDECGLRKSVAVDIAGIFKDAFSREHVDELERRVDEGFRELSTGTFDIYVENENSDARYDASFCLKKAGTSKSLVQLPKCRFLYALLNLSFPCLHRGQCQSAGRFSNFVPAGMPWEGSPTAGS